MAKAGRLFVQLDVNWYDEWGHQVSDDAALLWVVAMCACKRMILDGRLTTSQLRRIAPESLASTPARLDAAVSELCENEEAPITRDGNAVVLHWWAEWNDLAAEIEAMSEGGEWGNHLKWHVKRNKPKDGCRFCEDASGTRFAPESGTESKSRVEKSREDTELIARGVSAEPKAERPKSRTPAPDTFPIDDDLRMWANDHGLSGINLESETEHFLNHHGAKGSLMADWRKAWFTWMGRVPQFQRSPTSGRKQTSSDVVTQGMARIRAMEATKQQASQRPMLPR